jgi:hypothetical protein
MATFFRKIRYRLLSVKKAGSYLTYAVGEIVLVVIGILIAVSINNRNEERKQQRELNNVLQVIRTDLQQDTTGLNRLIAYYNRKEKFFLQVMSDTMKREDYRKCEDCRSLILNYRSLSISTRGYQLLQRHQGNSASELDTLLVEIDRIYASLISLNETTTSLVTNNINRNVTEWSAQHPWFPEVMQGEVTPSYLDYVSRGFDYRNKVTLQYVWLYDVYLGFLREYRQYAELLLSDIDEVLTED